VTTIAVGNLAQIKSTRNVSVVALNAPQVGLINNSNIELLSLSRMHVCCLTTYCLS